MVGMQHFNLRWNNYTSNILQEVFANQTQDKHPVIIMKDIRYEDLQAIIKFMYNGEIRVQETQLENLLAAAELLQVKGLSNVRSKYERGEITSLNRGPKLFNKQPSSESVVAEKKVTPIESPPRIIEEKPVTSSAPTEATTQAPNKSSPIVSRTLATPSPITITGTMTRIPASTLRAAKLAPRTGLGGSTVTFATLVPTNAIMTVSQANNLFRNTATASNSKIALTTTTSSALAISPATTIGVPRIPTTHTTSALTTPIITCVTGNFVGLNDPKTVGNNSFLVSAANYISKTPQLRAIPIYPPSMANNQEKSAVNEKNTETKAAAEPQHTPIIRKRRKMSHTVNELAKEAVFTSNGTILLESENTVAKNQTKNKPSTSAHIQTWKATPLEIEEITVKKIRATTETNVPEESRPNEEVEGGAQKIPRPPNAFMIYAAEWRKKFAIKNPDEDNKKISVMLGMKWKSLSIKEKESYYLLAKQAGEEHKEKYPGYYYSPQQARIRKMLRRDLARSKSSSSSPNHELQLMKACEHEEREIVQFSDSSEYEEDDDDYDNYKEDEEFDDDVILEEFIEEAEDRPIEKSPETAERKPGNQFGGGGNASSSNRGYFSKT